MLQAEEQDNPSAIEEHFCKPFSKFIPTQLSKDQIKLMILIYGIKEEDVADFEKDLTETIWFYPVIEKRIEYMCSYTMDKKAQMLLSSWCNSVGDVSMYVAYIQYLCKQRNIKHVTFDCLALLFGDGILSSEYARDVWYGQKVSRGSGHSDNIIDYRNAVQSLIF